MGKANNFVVVKPYKLVYNQYYTDDNTNDYDMRSGDNIT